MNTKSLESGTDLLSFVSYTSWRSRDDRDETSPTKNRSHEPVVESSPQVMYSRSRVPYQQTEAAPFRSFTVLPVILIACFDEEKSQVLKARALGCIGNHWFSVPWQDCFDQRLGYGAKYLPKRHNRNKTDYRQRRKTFICLSWKKDIQPSIRGNGLTTVLNKTTINVQVIIRELSSDDVFFVLANCNSKRAHKFVN